jgi:tetratricopeptide (TPR) repeat protein
MRAQRIGDVTGLAAANSVLGHIAYRQGDYATALPYYEASLGYFREAGDLYGIIVLLRSLMNVSDSLGDYKGAKVYVDERLQITRRIGHRLHIAESLYSLGLVATLLNQDVGAHGYFGEGLLACSELEEARMSLTAECLAGLASLLIKERNLEQGAQLLGAVERSLLEGEGELDSVFQDVYDRALTAAQEQLGEEAFATLWATGKAMTIDQALEHSQTINSEAALNLQKD